MKYLMHSTLLCTADSVRASQIDGITIAVCIYCSGNFLKHSTDTILEIQTWMKCHHNTVL